MQRSKPADLSMMRLRTASSALAALLAAGALGVAASGCGGGASATLDPIAQAAEVTNKAGGAQIAMKMTMQLPGLSSAVSMDGGGHFNAKAGEGSLTFTISGLPASSISGFSGGSVAITELLKSGTVYLTSPLFDGKLPNGAKWMKLDVAGAASSLGLDPQSLASGGANPADILSYLKGSTGSPKVAGHETVRGEETTRYDGTIDLEKVVDALPPADRAKARESVEALLAQAGNPTFPVSVWIDGAHRLRRMAMDMRFSTQGQSATVHLDLEMFGFGATPSVTAPASSETFDATSLTGSALSSTGG
jgi:hypothetical protein